MADKFGLRKTYLNKRRERSINQVKEDSTKIARGFTAFYADYASEPVHIFLPILKQLEIDTWPIIEFLRDREVSIVVSKSNFIDHTLSHYYLENDTELEVNSWGIPEPVKAKSASIDQLEMVIIPLVIFDQVGYRIGYGKGFYDKFLAQCPKNILKVGLSIFEAVPEISHDAHDVKMDFCITPNKTYEF